MASTFREMVEEIEATTYEYPHEIVAKYERLRGLIDETFASMQRRYAAIDADDLETRDSVAGHPARWRLENALDTLRIQIDERIRTITRGGRPVRRIITRHDTTLAALSYELKADLNSLIGLNPKLMYGQVVPKDSTVFYYAST